MTKPRQMIAVRSYEFEQGLLHLEAAAARSMSDDEITQEYAQYHGKLLKVTDGQMSARQFFALPDFRDL